MRSASEVALAFALSGCTVIFPIDRGLIGTDGGITACPALSAPTHGDVDRSEGMPGDVATYTCDGEYRLTGNGGSNTRTCQPDRMWSGSDPACAMIISACEPSPCLNGGACAVDGASFICTCEGTGYTGDTCEMRMPCPALTAPADGFVDRTSGSFGDVATYGCDSGFYLVATGASLTRTCGADAAWSGIDPTCRSSEGYPEWPLPGTVVLRPDYGVGSDTTIDNVTSLEWQTTLDTDLLAWDAARTYCADLALDGKVDWRLPTRVELASIIDTEEGEPIIDPTAFPGTPLASFWTSSPIATVPGSAWMIDFRAGIYDGDRTIMRRVRCVRGTPVRDALLAARFTDNGDGTVTDEVTALVWRQAASPSTMTYNDAISYCNSFGGGGWRVPALIELLSLIDENRAMPAIDSTVFPSTPSEGTWTSSARVNVAGNNFSVDFTNGTTGVSPTGLLLRARCVR